MGRPSSYTPEIAREICERLAAGESLRQIAKSNRDMPDRRTVQRWAEDDPDFAAEIARARDAGFDERAEKAVENAHASKEARLAFDAERWYLSKLNPKRYGERTTIAGDPEAPLVVASDPAAIPALIADILGRAAVRDASDLA